ncbi:hypothetical protein M378DRAFT_560946 [Amanita muscaria Koide BX008]|uniref:NACHT domain-containing protein n=1 Tax=Amanita muscaria (strain Koide BX008) TaxID=946122 RepID=A0A0C2W410_AMAMK|nr:hypothetical protein M378DRAFT_560946 [Amanita muscaria Koide BX008]
MVLYVLSYLTFELPSMSKNTSNRAAFGNANFTGGGHAFGGNSTVNNYGPNANELKEHQLITTLPRAEAGRKVHEESGPCFPGTREAILQTMKEWATNSKESRMYVLSGLAGIGKSTVAYTIAAWADEPERHLLGAEFFLSRDEADRRSAKLFFTTIAYDLYFAKSGAFKRAIGEALVTKGRFTGSPQEQLDALILDPLKPIRNDLPSTLIVVDALDECDYKDDARLVFDGLRKLVQALPSFKVILTTRPDALSNNVSTAQEGRKVFRLHDIEDDVVNEDIRIYLKYSLSAEQVKERLPDLRKQWYASDAQVERLIQASGKLFIMASTAVRYVLEERWSAPDSQIKTLLGAFAQGRTPFDNLVDFYTIILRSAVPDKCHDTPLVERYQAIVGTIVLAQVPLSVHSIAKLIDIDVDQILVVLRQLQSVVSVADDIPRVYHKSFVDYITDSEQCKDINLRIDPTKRHTWIARRCFEMMGKRLKFNILELGIPARFMSNEEGLAKDGISNEKLQKKIPLALQYACAYWDDHLNSANIDDADLVKGLERFDNARVLLPWFEVLSLIRKLNSAPRAIRVALNVLKPTPSDLRQLLSDGLRFISKFYEIIERSALHTYYSALPFTPTDSLLYRRYIDEALHLHRGCNVIGISNQWDALLANLNHGRGVNNIQFSLDSTMLVSWNGGSSSTSQKAMLKVWDAVAGTPISTIKGGSGSFAIANDFSTVASFKGNAITLYNVNGSEQGVTFTTSAEVLQAAIWSSRIAAGLSDGTVSLWDTRDSQDGRPIGSFGDYQDWGRLEISATGRLAYLSAKTKGVVRLWDVIKGEFVADLDWGSRGFAFSGNGSQIVSWQKKSGVKLWDCADGQPVGTIKNNLVNAVAISDNGSLIAFGCITNVEVWGGNRGNLSRVVDLDLPRLQVWLLAFSGDDTLAIATRSYVKLYSVKNRSFLSTHSVSSHHALALSPDFTRFAAGRLDGTVSLSVIDSSSPSSNQQELTALALSWNCSRVACGFEDGAVELWETDGLRRIAAHRHHRQFGRVMMLGFSPDGKQFASGSEYGTINLWDGEDGARRADLQYNGLLKGVEFSNSVLAAAGNHGISLWDCKTLDLIQTFDGYFTTLLSFSADGALLAATHSNWISNSITVFDVTSNTDIATFKGSREDMRTIGFLSDNSQLVLWQREAGDSKFDFLTLDLVSEKAIRGPSFEKFIQLPDMPLWHGVPVWVNKGEQYYLEALFSQHDDPVPVLWIPRELDVLKWVQRRSMIAIQCKDGRVVLLRLPTTATGTAARAGYDDLSYGRPTAAAALPYGQNTHVPTALVGNEVREEVGEFTSGEFRRESQRLGPPRHRRGICTTAMPPLPSQRQESPAPTPSVLNLNEPAAITYHPQRQPTPSQCCAQPDTGVSVGYTPPPVSLPHTGQVERRSQRLRPSSHRHEMYTTAPPPPLPSQRRQTTAPSPRPPPALSPPRRRESPAPSPRPPPVLPPPRRESPAHTPPPLPPLRRGPISDTPSALNMNRPAASRHSPLPRQSIPTRGQYWAPPETDVAVGHMPLGPASPPHTGQVGRGPKQPRPQPHRHREYTTTTRPPPDGPWPRDFR